MNFDWLVYRELNPDLKEAGLLTKYDYERHFRLHCAKDNRIYNIYQVYPDFNHIIYSNIYSDLKNMSKHDLERHWIRYGRNEQRVYKNDVSKKTVITNPIITFIIPTVGRSTIIKTVKSIQAQTNNNWKCIIVCDGIELNSDIKNIVDNDDKISVIKILKTGFGNNAGHVRNNGIKAVDTEWVGFVDDDDELSPLYVETAINSISENNGINCIIFRMMYNDGGIFPNKNSKNFVVDRVGISFCYKMSLTKAGINFEPGNREDFVLLNKIRSLGHKILMSNKICYFVRPTRTIDILYVNALNSIENDITKAIIN
jgi:hypothetical protein